MSTVVDNDKYIINGSTLSEIGDAIKGQMPNQYETVTEDVVCYKYTKSIRDTGVTTLLNLTEEKIQGWYQNTLPSPITKVKIIMTIQGNSGAWVEVNGNKESFTLNKSYTYSLPVKIIGSSGGYMDQDYAFKIYPLNGDNYLSWDSNYYYPSSSSDYNAHLYKEEVSYERLLPKNFLVSDIAQKIVNLFSGGTIEPWYWSSTQERYYLPFPSDFSVKNLKDLTCLSGNYPRGLYKDSLGKPVSMKDQEISLPSSFYIGSPLTEAKISAAHNEGRTFCIPWNWKGVSVKSIPDDVSFIWFVVEPADSKIYIGAGRYVNSTGIGKCTVFYTT